MTSEEMADLKQGDRISYNDGREGHSGVIAIVVESGASVTIVQFADRADTTAIAHSDRGWTDYLGKVGLCAS